MAECPNTDCQKRQDGHHTTLYGSGGMGGLVSCVQKMVSRTFLMWCAVIAISVGGTVGGLTYRAYSGGQKQLKEQLQATYCTKEQYHEMQGKFIGLQRDMEYIRQTTDELKANSNQVLNILKDLDRRGKNAGDD